jgi:Dyp-type peroxidase family
VKPEPLINLALTYNGLRSLGLGAILQAMNPNLVLDDQPRFPKSNPFALEFRRPPDEGTLGDLSDADRRSTWWDGQGDDSVYPRLHAMLQIYARTEAVLDQAVEAARARAQDLGVKEVVKGPDGQPLGGAALPDRKVHFGYVDGISQPIVDWENFAPAPGLIDRRYFLLGDPSEAIPSSPDPDKTGDLFKNGCYVAFRWLSQDVPGFERFLDQNASRLAPNRPAAEARELLAAKLVGRWRGGAPLVLSPDHDDQSLQDRNDFGYKDADPTGLRCPFSSHIRASNPRDQPLDSVVVNKVPPLLRRGTSYGPEWIPGRNDQADRGLLGMFLCSSLERQFQQIVRWMNQNDFSPVFSGKLGIRHDPLFGARSNDPNPSFHIPIQGGAVEVPLPKAFVRSRGTAYFLLPGLKTLDRLLA